MAFILQRVLTMIGLHQNIRMEILDWFPRIVTVWVPFPFDEVLKSPPLAEEPMINDGFYFVFRVFVHEVWGWSGVVRSVRGSLFERDQQRGMEDVMNPPGLGEIELKGDRRDNSFDVEGSLSPRRELV